METGSVGRHFTTERVTVMMDGVEHLSLSRLVPCLSLAYDRYKRLFVGYFPEQGRIMDA